jgi:hypothetical protein
MQTHPLDICHEQDTWNEHGASPAPSPVRREGDEASIISTIREPPPFLITALARPARSRRHWQK